MMDDLPPELLELIMQQCDFASLKHMRLVAKRLEHIATPRVFHDVYAAFFAYSLDNIGNIANSRVAKYAKTLTVYSNFLPILAQDQWRKEAFYRPHFPTWFGTRKEDIVRDCTGAGPTAYLNLVKINAHLDNDTNGGPCRACVSRIEGLGIEYNQEFPHRPDLTSERLDEAWARYCSLKDEQWNGLITEDVHGMMLKEHLSRLPSLESVAVRATTATEGEIKKSTVWKSLERDILYSLERVSKHFRENHWSYPPFLSSPLLLRGSCRCYVTESGKK